jgi:hypothetical protein
MKQLWSRTGSALVLASALLLSACAGVPADLSGRTVNDLGQVDLSKGRQISATSSGFQLLFFIPIGINSRHDVAYKSLLEEAGDGLISDITITEGWRYGFVGTIYTTTIEATVYPRTAKTAAASK